MLTHSRCGFDAPVHFKYTKHSMCLDFSLDRPRLTAMNVTDFRDNALLKLQVAGPFAGGMIDLTTQEYILIQVEQTEQPGQRRRRTQQVRAASSSIFLAVLLH